ncbi:MAG: CpsD/CapB family tyrosine-protein kinase [Clostridia bacterium]|nr:CpsD/CapB family tyrosine-protein kinase [Clostridia bacterium]
MNFVEKIKDKKIFLTLILIVSLIVGWIYIELLAPKLFVSSSSMMIFIKETGAEEQTTKSSCNLTLSDDVYHTIEELIKSNSVYGKATKNANISNSEIFVYKYPDSNIFRIQIKSYNQDSSIKLLKEVNNVFSTEIKNINQTYEVYVVDEPKVIDQTYNSNCVQYIFISLFVGILFDILYIFVSIISEKQYNATKREVEEEFSLKELARIPYKKISNPYDINEIISSDDDVIHLNRSLRKLRANIQFINVNNNDKKTFLITSPLRYEGKTFLTINLANSYAEIGKKVIIVDCDLNNGIIDKIFGLENTIGTSNFLSGLDNNGGDLNKKIKDYIICSNINGVDIIPSGIVPPNSSELLSSKNLQLMINALSQEYDTIIIDGPETLRTADSLIITRIIGTTILVADVKNTKYEDLIQAKNDLQNVGGRIVGIVVNKVKSHDVYGDKNVFKRIVSFFSDLFRRFKDYLEKQKRLKEKRLLEEAKEVEEKPEDTESNVTEDFVQMSMMDKDELIESNYTIQEVVEEKDNKKTLYEVQDKSQDAETITNEIIKEVVEEATTENHLEEEEVIDEEILSEDVSEVILNEPETRFDEEMETKKKKPRFFSKFSQLFGEKQALKNDNETVETSENKEAEVESNQDITYVEDDSNPDNILVIVDSENGCARAFNQECYTEKIIRGLDKGDGYIKAYYSPLYAGRRIEALMATYGISKAQAKRIDPLIQSVLTDFDEKIWIYKRVASNTAEQYITIMSKDYDKEENENIFAYKKRCKEQRKKELKDNNIEIAYNLNIMKTSSDITFIDKLAMNKYANILGDTTKKILNNSIENILDVSHYSKDDYEKRYDDEQYASMQTEIMNKLSENFEDNNILSDKKKIELLEQSNLQEMHKILNEKKNYKNEVDALKRKSRIERNAIDLQSGIQEEKNALKEPEYEENLYKIGSFSDSSFASEDKRRQREENAVLRKEKKQEQQLLKKIKREKRILKREEERKKKKIEKKERDSRREEERQIREFRKAQEKEEARIEEELLDNNLYPKTKNLKNL